MTERPTGPAPSAPSGGPIITKMTEPPGTPRKPSPWWRSLRADPPFVLRIVIGLAFVAVILLVWWLLTRGTATTATISPSKLPGPGSVFGSFDALLERDLGESIWASMRRVLTGILYAAVVGIGLGVTAASYRAVAAALTPLLIFLRSIPMGALLPLTVVWFSTGEQQKEMFIFLAIVPFVFSDTMKAISLVPQRYVETAETLGASRFQIIRKVLFPLALPDILTSLRFQFGLALGYIMLAEAIAASAGLGFLLNNSERRGLTEQIYLLLFLIAGIAFAIDWLFRYFQRGFFSYRTDL